MVAARPTDVCWKIDLKTLTETIRWMNTAVMVVVDCLAKTMTGQILGSPPDQ